MKTFEVILSKSYSVKINADNEQSARDLCELFTGDINDISSIKDRELYNFSIEEIECKINDTFGVEEVYA